ncbi:MAG TPA: hypothetical protein VHX92_06970 [Rhizomicrobium sp.]|jgi:hypothetical protein|nr:hypothetical protein [Rhizomicrobium sp.]
MAGFEGNAIAKKQLAQREAMWPGMEANLWNRKANKGFATIPKTMPIVLKIMDEMSKGKPLSSTYLGLWCSTWDNSLVNISKPAEMAHSAGFSGQRAEYTWGARMQLLKGLHFIDIKPGKTGAMSHVLIWNPHYVVRWHYINRTLGLVEGSYNALLERAVELGANDLLHDAPTWLVEGPFAPTPPPSLIPAAVPAPPSTPPAASP